LEKAVSDKLIPYNYCKNTSLPKIIKKEVRAFSTVEQNTFVEALNKERLGTAFMVSLFAGLRRGEVLGLKWDNVDLEKGIIRIRQALVRTRIFNQDKKTEIIEQDPKTKSGRRNIPLPNKVVELLIKHKEKQELEKSEKKDEYEDRGYVFATETGKPVEPRNYLRTFYRLIKNLDIQNANVHSMRHYATRGLELNIPLQVLQKLMGHASITTLVDTYGHSLPETKKEAAVKYNSLLKSDKETPPKE
jgi:integrase